MVILQGMKKSIFESFCSRMRNTVCQSWPRKVTSPPTLRGFSSKIRFIIVLTGGRWLGEFSRTWVLRGQQQSAHACCQSFTRSFIDLFIQQTCLPQLQAPRRSTAGEMARAVALRSNKERGKDSRQRAKHLQRGKAQQGMLGKLQVCRIDGPWSARLETRGNCAWKWQQEPDSEEQFGPHREISKITVASVG